VLYGVLLASTNLYHFLSPTVGFVLLALVTAGAVVLALRQGPVVAIMGLLGGFAIPVLVGAPEPDARGLFLYLLVLTVGINTIARRRGWPLVSILTVLFGNLWAGLWLVFSASTADVKWVALFLVGAAATLVATAARSSGPATRRAAWLLPGLTLRLIAFANIVLALVLLGVALRQLGFNTLEWALLCLVALACVALERFDARYGGLSWLAGAVLLAFLQLWHIEGLAGQTTRFGLTALEAGLVFTAGGFACLARSRREGYWASLSATGALTYFITAYAGLSGETSGWWALGAAGCAGLMAGAVMAPAREPARAAYGVAAALFIIIALSIGLSGAPRIIALAVLLPALAFIETRFFAPRIEGRWAGLRARRGEAISAMRLVFLPLALWTGLLALDDISATPQPYGAWWLVAVLAIPALAALAGTWQLRTHRAGRSAVVLEAAFCVFAFLFFTLEVSPLLGSRRGPLWTSDLVQIGFYPVIWLTLALVLREARRWWPSPAFKRAAIIIGGLGVAYFVLMPLLNANPLWSAANPVAGPKIFNALLWVYGAPAALFTIAGWRLEGRWRAWAQGAALAVCFLTISLEVRHWFHGADLTGWRFGQAEQYTYSIVWMIFGAALLAPGIMLGRPAMRYAALSVLALAVVKVFGFDTAHLEGLLRVASLLGLGLGLLALAYIYQRFVAPASE
jgi:uncharacterized membrane protein